MMVGLPPCKMRPFCGEILVSSIELQHVKYRLFGCMYRCVVFGVVF